MTNYLVLTNLQLVTMHYDQLLECIVEKNSNVIHHAICLALKLTN